MDIFNQFLDSFAWLGIPIMLFGIWSAIVLIRKHLFEKDFNTLINFADSTEELLVFLENREIFENGYKLPMESEGITEADIIAMRKKQTRDWFKNHSEDFFTRAYNAKILNEEGVGKRGEIKDLLKRVYYDYLNEKGTDKHGKVIES